MVANHPPFPGSTSPPLLVGREREQAILRDRLAAALCRDATDQGALVLTGRCYDVSETPPYGPWLELFARYRPTEGAPPLPPFLPSVALSVR